MRCKAEGVPHGHSMPATDNAVARPKPGGSGCGEGGRSLRCAACEGHNPSLRHDALSTTRGTRLKLALKWPAPTPHFKTHGHPDKNPGRNREDARGRPPGGRSARLHCAFCEAGSDHRGTGPTLP
ncbi:protein of unknown function [Denitratisoma oestradiolicum]|uniref:Uncharacterized protein n=1 Tax=Denitratisoma oestradiolicum TaxID=311182 RepID=A0A6S6XTZ5_9PROT|nr:protein of unknown function [Denitratisoma oestradiolicum]